jgi:hypothetical protein
VITVDILPGSPITRMSLSRNEFVEIEGNPTKGAIRNWEGILRRYLSDYREETPSTDHDITPYQQWVLLVIHQEFRGWKNNHTRLKAIEAWVKKNKEKIRKKVYDNENQ